MSTAVNSVDVWYNKVMKNIDAEQPINVLRFAQLLVKLHNESEEHGLSANAFIKSLYNEIGGDEDLRILDVDCQLTSDRYPGTSLAGVSSTDCPQSVKLVFLEYQDYYFSFSKYFHSDQLWEEMENYFDQQWSPYIDYSKEDLEVTISATNLDRVAPNSAPLPLHLSNLLSLAVRQERSETTSAMLDENTPGNRGYIVRNRL